MAETSKPEGKQDDILTEIRKQNVLEKIGSDIRINQNRDGRFRVDLAASTLLIRAERNIAEIRSARLRQQEDRQIRENASFVDFVRAVGGCCHRRRTPKADAGGCLLARTHES